MAENVNDRVLAMFKALSSQTKSEFPPKVASILEGVFLELDEEKVKMAFPVKEAFNNPFQITFGGIYGMWLDQIFGLFSGIVTMAPTTSLDLNITYYKSVSPEDKTVIVTAQVVNKSKTFINLKGEIRKEDGELCASGTSRMMILDPKRMK